MFAFVAFTIVHEHGGQIPVQRYVALAHAEAICLRCVCIVLEALLAWRGVAWRGVAWRGVAWRSSSVAFLLVPLPPSAFFLIYLFSYFLLRGFVHFTSTWRLASV